MRKKLILSSILGLALFCQSTDSFSVNWPVIDSQNRYHHPVIEKFISNAKSLRSTFQYIGHQFKVRDVNGHNIQENMDLYNNIDILKEAFAAGHHVEIKPTSSKDVYKDFEERCKYKILVDGETFIEGFRVFNAENDIIQPIQVNNNNPVQPQQPIVENQLPSVSQDLVSNWIDRRLGRGAPFSENYGGVKASVINNLLQTHKNHPILKYAFDYMKAADLADIQDPILFADYIQNHGYVAKTDVIDAMNQDLAYLKQVEAFGFNEGDEEFGLDYKDQIKYPGKTIDKAIKYINKYPTLLQGKLHDDLKSLKGSDSISLLFAQYYVAALQSKNNRTMDDFKVLLKKIGGLYAHMLPNSDARIKNILKKTTLVVDNVFYTPAHNYIKHGDVTKTIKQEIANLPNNLNVSGKLTQIYSDCSGFSIMILRKLFPDYDWIQGNRAMSWQFAGAYDLLAADGQIATHYIKNNRKERLLSAREKSLNKGNKFVVEKLSKILEAVTHNNDRQAGDILVKRPIDAECEGHVMTIVDPHPTNNPNEVIIVELTQYSGFNGARNGLVWRKVDLTNCGVTRILRPKL